MRYACFFDTLLIHIVKEEFFMATFLVLGGTRFFGKKLVERLIKAGHTVTIATRGQAQNPFGDAVEHLQFDRTDAAAFEAAVDGRAWDIVYDNICYSPNDAREAVRILEGKAGKLVFTSSLATYDPRDGIRSEEDFNPLAHEVREGNTADFTYGEGKRQVEAVYYQYASFPVVAVRFPIVVGEDDYTERLLFHVQHVLEGKTMAFVSLDARMSYITSDEAAAFLQWAGEKAPAEPFNATATGSYTIAEFIALVEQATNKRAKIAIGGDEATRSPYAVGADWYMTNDKATKAGFTFSQLDGWLLPLIKKLVAAEH